MTKDEFWTSTEIGDYRLIRLSPKSFWSDRNGWREMEGVVEKQSDTKSVYFTLRTFRINGGPLSHEPLLYGILYTEVIGCV